MRQTELEVTPGILSK